MSDWKSPAPAGTTRVLEELDDAECIRLISPGGVGRLGFTGRYRPDGAAGQLHDVPGIGCFPHRA